MSYTPRPGSVAERAISHLAASGPMLRADLAAAIGVPTGNLNGNIGAAVRNGAIARDTERFWLPAEREPVSGDLQPTPGSAIDWTVRQVFANADLPFRDLTPPKPPKPPSIIERVAEFVCRQREWVCVRDVQREFGLRVSWATRLLKLACGEGLIELKRPQDGRHPGRYGKP